MPAHAQSQTHKTTELYKCWENNRIRVQIRVKAFWYAKKKRLPHKISVYIDICFVCVSVSVWKSERTSRVPSNGWFASLWIVNVKCAKPNKSTLKRDTKAYKQKLVENRLLFSTFSNTFSGTENKASATSNDDYQSLFSERTKDYIIFVI